MYKEGHKVDKLLYKMDGKEEADNFHLDTIFLAILNSHLDKIFLALEEWVNRLADSVNS